MRLWVKGHALEITLLEGSIEFGGVGLVDDFEAVFFDDRIRKNFFGDFFELLLGLVAGPAVEVEDEEFALADVFYFGVAEAVEGVLDGLTLRIEDGALWHDPNVCLHSRSIAFHGISTNGGSAL